MAIKLTSSTQPVFWQNELPEKRTYIVLGCPRGGTSMASGALRLAGIDMGDNINTANNEDRNFLGHNGFAILSDPVAKAEFVAQTRALIRSKNTANDVWGWKDPLSAYYLPDLIEDIRNPHIVLITRDVSAVALRERVENKLPDMDAYTFRVADRVLEGYAAAFSLVSSKKIPSLLVSYERVLRYPEDFAKNIIRFTKTPDQQDRSQHLVEKITKYVQPDKLTGDIEASSAKIQKAAGNAQNAVLLGFGSLTDCYQSLSQTVNSADYGNAATLAQATLSEIDLGFINAPKIKGSPEEVADVKAGVIYIKAIACANLQEEQTAFSALCQYFDQAVIVFSLYPNHTAITRSVMAAAEKLIVQISNNFGAEFVQLVQAKIAALNAAASK